MKRPTPISAEDYPRKDKSKNNRLQTDKNSTNCIDHFVPLNQHEYFTDTEREGGRHMAKVNINKNTDEADVMQSGKNENCWQELKNHTHNQEPSA